jgi:hypothetical protein
LTVDSNAAVEFGNADSIAAGDITAGGLDEVAFGDNEGIQAMGRAFVHGRDQDTDLIVDDIDNCSLIANPGQENQDGDPRGDACELAGCETVATFWNNPIGDGDCDGFPNDSSIGGRGHEAFIGTDPMDRCPDNTSDNAWPPDLNNNGWVNLSDVIQFGPVFNTVGPSPPYNPRFDLNAAPQPNGAVNLSDVIALGPFFNKACTQ